LERFAGIKIFAGKLEILLKFIAWKVIFFLVPRSEVDFQERIIHSSLNKEIGTLFDGAGSVGIVFGIVGMKQFFGGFQICEEVMVISIILQYSFI
jgi:hypothetical protein